MRSSVAQQDYSFKGDNMKRYSTGIVILSESGACEFHILLPRGHKYSVMVSGFDKITPASHNRLMRATKTWRKAITRTGELALFNPAFETKGD